MRSKRAALGIYLFCGSVDVGRGRDKHSNVSGCGVAAFQRGRHEAAEPRSSHQAEHLERWRPSQIVRDTSNHFKF